MIKITEKSPKDPLEVEPTGQTNPENLAPSTKGENNGAKELKSENFKLDTTEMTQAGLNFGCKSSNCHPKMKPYLQGTKNSIDIIDLKKTEEEFNKALKFIEKLVSENKNILFVGTKIQIKNLVKEIAIECNYPYIIERWLGGTFTNHETILKRIEHYKDLETKKKNGELLKYTKKEQINFNKELKRLEIKFGGIKELTKLPDAIIALSIKKDNLAIKESREKNIKIIGIVNTNCDPSLLDYPIPANNEAISSVKYILDKIKEVILKIKPKTSPTKTN